MSLKPSDRVKAVSIENKWFSSIIQNMYQKYKLDSRVRFQLKIEDPNISVNSPYPEELYMQQIINPNEIYNSDKLNLENFFYLRSDRYVIDEKGINEDLFLKEIRFFSLKDQNDTLTLSNQLVTSETELRFYLDSFSNNKIFSGFNNVVFDSNTKQYSWDINEWFDIKEYNTISEFIIAYIEQVLNIR